MQATFFSPFLIAGTDYEAVSQTVSFGQGAGVKTMSITILPSGTGSFELTLESSACTNDIIKTTVVTIEPGGMKLLPIQNIKVVLFLSFRCYSDSGV